MLCQVKEVPDTTIFCFLLTRVVYLSFIILIDAHNAAIYFVKRGFAPTLRPNALEASQKVSLASRTTSGFVFPNAIGLAAGFDKGMCKIDHSKFPNWCVCTS